MRYISLMSLLAATAVLSGCVSLTPELQARYTGAIDTALSESPTGLEQRAKDGNGHAQLSYSIVLRYGLNGVPIDSSSADFYRARAVASRGTTTSAIYVPDSRTSGHTQLISVPQYDVSQVEARSVENCAALLASHGSIETARSQVETGTCGGEENFLRLRALWTRAGG